MRTRCADDGASGAAATRRPAARNLLLVSIDTLRADALGVYGGKRRATRFLDAFARRSTVFESAWTHSPKTAPAHMSMLTGLPPSVHGVGNLNTEGSQTLSDDVRLLPEVLHGAGFRTAGFTDGGNMKGTLGFARGFEEFDDEGGAFDVRAQEVADWIEGARSGGRPWFCFLHTYAVHDPYLPPQPFVDAFAKDYDGDILHERRSIEAAIARGDDRAPNLTGHDKFVWNYWFRVDESDPDDLEHLHDLYTAGVAYMDRVIGAFLKQLEDAGVLEDTLVVITSDHGEEFGEHGGVRHDQLYVECTHVPLVVHLPRDLAKGRRIAGTVRHIDLVPSVLELLGVDDDPGALRLGHSWAGWLRGEATEDERTVLGEHRSRRRTGLDTFSLREGDLVLHERPVDGDGARQVFDRADDPGERKPLDDAAVVNRLAARLAEERDQLARLAGTIGPGGAIELTPELRAELESLGYLRGDE
ncbi:MAG: sulfatase [Planctomycetota bacterium]